jgi:hypothetical protein
VAISTRFTDAQVVEFIEKHHTLHTKIDMLYVVDGYEVTLLRDEREISETFKGDTLRDALCKMMEAIDPPVIAPKSLLEKWSALERSTKIVIASCTLALITFFGIPLVSVTSQAIERNYIKSVLENPEKKFPLSTELTSGFQAIQKKAVDAGLKYASLPGFNVSFIDCDGKDEYDSIHRNQKSAFGIGSNLMCKDILPIKKLVVIQRDDRSMQIYTDRAYQDLPDRLAPMLAERIYINLFGVYTNKLTRMYTGRVDNESIAKVKALATHDLAD